MTSLLQMAQFRLAGIGTLPQRFAVSRLAVLLGRADLPSRAEFAALRPATRVLMTGFAAWIGLVGAITLIAIIWVELSTSFVPAWLGTRGTGSRGAATRITKGYENIVQRPLFSRSRQETVVAEPVAAQPPAAMTLDPGVVLKGVFMSDGLAKAFLITSQNPVGVWVEVNGQIDGWRVAAVTPEQIVLEGQNEKLVVPLNVSSSR